MDLLSRFLGLGDTQFYNKRVCLIRLAISVRPKIIVGTEQISKDGKSMSEVTIELY